MKIVKRRNFSLGEQPFPEVTATFSLTEAELENNVDKAAEFFGIMHIFIRLFSLTLP